MVTIEQIDEFRKRTNSSYEDAKYYLEKNNGDILEAIIDFERSKTGKSYHSYKHNNHKYYRDSCCQDKNHEYGRKFSDLLQKGFDTKIYVEDKNTVLFSVPIIFLLLLIPLWFIVMVMFIFFAMLGYKISVRDEKSRNINVNDFFQNVTDKMKESNPGSRQTAQQKPAQPPATTNSSVPVTQNPSKEPTEKKDDSNDDHKDDGFKEYTIE